MSSSPPNDDTPVRPPPAEFSQEAEAATDIQMCCFELARCSGEFAARVDKVPSADRAHVLALYRETIHRVSQQLDALTFKLAKA